MDPFVCSMAEDLIQQLHITSADLNKEGNNRASTRFLWQKYSEVIRGKLKDVGPATFGNIAWCGKGYDDLGSGTPMYLVQDLRHWLDAEASGQRLLETIAVTVLIAQIFDILRGNRDT